VRAVDLIAKKRDGYRLSEAEIDFLIKGYTDRSIPDYQMAAFLMAVFFKGMDARETSCLTLAMRDSGESIVLDSIKGPKIDKHSTGGVGDKISLVLAPIVASCGIVVPMMSGRGLGHTGGTIDKLESVPGYKTDISRNRFVEGLRTIGYSMIGQSATVAPSDKLMYALRDVTATVESIPLITSSILSKKCAEGADGFVFDVKCGAGAFMKKIEDARALARSLVNASREMGKSAAAIVTDMDEPLGFAVGNFCEVEEAAACLCGKGPSDVMEVTMRLASRMLILARVCSDIGTAETLCSSRIADGTAYGKFIDNIKFQGGDPDYITGKKRMKQPRVKNDVISNRSGYVSNLDAFGIGHASVIIGAGRSIKEDNVLPNAGIILCKKKMDKTEMGEALAVIYGDDEDRVREACRIVGNAYAFSADKPMPPGSKILEEMVE
jgi:pyrimidine-nucleoside phosphorylase